MVKGGKLIIRFGGVVVGVQSREIERRHAVLYLIAMVVAARFLRAESFSHSGAISCLHVCSWGDIILSFVKLIIAWIVVGRHVLGSGRARVVAVGV
jgi:hypothetical protein